MVKATPHLFHPYVDSAKGSSPTKKKHSISASIFMPNTTFASNRKNTLYITNMNAQLRSNSEDHKV